MRKILKNFRDIKIFKCEPKSKVEEAATASSPLYSIESVLPDANFAAEISNQNLDEFNEDSYYEKIFIRAKHAILTKLECSSQRRATVIFAKHTIVDSKVDRFIVTPLTSLGYNVNINKKPNNDNNNIPFDYWIEITW